MLSLPPAVRIYLATAPTNMHLSFDRLAALVRDVIRADPLSGYLFVFRNKPGTHLKILGWDRSGYCLWYKHAPVPQRAGYPRRGRRLLDGIDLSAATRRRHFARPRPHAAAR